MYVSQKWVRTRTAMQVHYKKQFRKVSSLPVLSLVIFIWCLSSLTAHIDLILITNMLANVNFRAQTDMPIGIVSQFPNSFKILNSIST